MFAFFPYATCMYAKVLLSQPLSYS